MKMTAQQAKAPATATPATITPHEGWVVHSQEFGFMRTDDGENLVSMVDVVRWLMNTIPIHRPGAIRMVTEAITVDVLPGVYFTSRDAAPVAYVALDSGPWAEFAPSVPVRFMGERLSGETAQALREWLSQPESARKADMLRERIESEVTHWLDNSAGLADPQTSKSVFAIPMRIAAKLWGYGLAEQLNPASAQPSTWPELVRQRKGHRGLPWTDVELQLLAQEKTRRGAGAVAAIAAELGVSVEAINGALRRSRKRQPASRAGRVVHISGSAK